MANSYKLNDKDVYFDTINADLEHKIIANKKVCGDNKYFTSPDNYQITPSVFDSQEITIKKLNGFNKDIYYQGNVDAIVSTSKKGYKVFWNDVFNNKLDNHTDLLQSDPVTIKYKSTPHTVFKLKKGNIDNYILPKVNGDAGWSLNRFYPDTKDDAEISWLDGDSYNQNTIEDKYIDTTNIQYLYLAEISRNKDSKTLFGEPTEEVLEKQRKNASYLDF